MVIYRLISDYGHMEDMDGLSDEIQDMIDTAPKEAKSDIEAGNIVIDVTECCDPAAACLAMACFQGVAGIHPQVLDRTRSDEPIDIWVFRQYFAMQYRKEGYGNANAHQASPVEDKK